MKLLWMTDLHLDKADPQKRKAVLETFRASSADAALLTGDLSNAENLSNDLWELGQACAPRKLFFVLGNHDFYGSSFHAVDAAVAEVCKRQPNLQHLGKGSAVPLTATTVLLGHRGWADGRAGLGSRSSLGSSDHRNIEELRLSENAFAKMANLGEAAAHYFREKLPYALSCYRNVWIATHVPPFQQAALYDGKQCGSNHLPHFTNLAAGGVIGGIARAPRFRDKKITVLCGHTHHPANLSIRSNVSVMVSDSKTPQLLNLS